MGRPGEGGGTARGVGGEAGGNAAFAASGAPRERRRSRPCGGCHRGPREPVWERAEHLDRQPRELAVLRLVAIGPALPEDGRGQLAPASGAGTLALARGR